MSLAEDIKHKIDIVDVISEHVHLEKAGQNFKALCPFHNEKHPSFFVFPEQQTWHCFGACGTGGDVFSFIMKKEGVEFGQSLRILAERAGISLSSQGPTRVAENEAQQRLFHVTDAAAEYYHHILTNTATGEVARKYLNARKLSPEVISDFRLGYSPNGWDVLKTFLQNKGYKDEEIEQAGLIISKEGNSYDRFRNRLMFPICDIQGRVTGFGARALDNSQPKYINSPQTPLFDKSSTPYGIDRAKNAIRTNNLVIVVEGYMDTIKAHQHGWNNVVASMGTSLTEKQVEVIKRLTKHITLALDADTAGEEATLRGIETLVKSLGKGIVDAELKVISLPQGKDPDDVIEESPSTWQNLVQEALPSLDFAFQVTISKLDLNKAKDKSTAAQKLLPLISEITDPIYQAHYIQKLANILKVSEATLVTNLKKLHANRRRQTYPMAGESFNPQRPDLASPLDSYCLALLLQYPDLRSVAQELSPDHFESTENRELFLAWQRDPDINTLSQKLDPGLAEHIQYLYHKSFPPAIKKDFSNRQTACSDCILRLQERLTKRSQREREFMFSITREKEGIAAELAKLEEQGILPDQQLQEIFIREGNRRNKNDTSQK